MSSKDYYPTNYRLLTHIFKEFVSTFVISTVNLYTVAQRCSWNAALRSLVQSTHGQSQRLQETTVCPCSLTLMDSALRDTTQKRSRQNCFFFLLLKSLRIMEMPTELKESKPIWLCNFVIFSFLFSLLETSKDCDLL